MDANKVIILITAFTMEHNLEIIDITPNSNLKLGKKKFDVDVNRLWFSCKTAFDEEEINTAEFIKLFLSYAIKQQDNYFYIKLKKEYYNSIIDGLNGTGDYCKYHKVRFGFHVNNSNYLGFGFIFKYRIELNNIFLTICKSRYILKRNQQETTNDIILRIANGL